MAWLVLSRVYGFMFGWTAGNLDFAAEHIRRDLDPLLTLRIALHVLNVGVSDAALTKFTSLMFPTVVTAALVIGGFVVVGQMLGAHGSVQLRQARSLFSKNVPEHVF